MQRSKRLLLAATLAVALPTAPAVAQTAMELVTVAAISATLDSSISLPRGTARVVTAKVRDDFVRQYLAADVGKYKDFELYVATGIVSNVAAVYAHNVEVGYAAAGYFQSGTATKSVGGETITTSEYANPDNGKTLLLLMVRRKDGVFVLSAAKR
jgi:hypothetical protein